MQSTTKETWFQSLKFLLFSLSAGIIQIASFTLLTECILTFDKGNDYGWSYFISLTLSVIWNFTFNRKFTFKSAKNVPVAMGLVFLYYCAFTPLSILWGNALTGIGWNEYLVLVITMVINFVTEFLWCRFVVYRGNINTNVKATKEPSDKQADSAVDDQPNTANNDKKEH